MVRKIIIRKHPIMKDWEVAVKEKIGYSLRRFKTKKSATSFVKRIRKIKEKKISFTKWLDKQGISPAEAGMLHKSTYKTLKREYKKR